MDFIIGGRYQGKLNYVTEQYGYTPKDIIEGANIEEIAETTAVCLYGLHRLIKALMKKQIDVGAYLQELFTRHTFEVIVSDEIGYGIVPVDSFGREYRELVGRQSCIIAQQAERVIRINSGLPQRIK